MKRAASWMGPVALALVCAACESDSEGPTAGGAVGGAGGATTAGGGAGGAGGGTSDGGAGGAAIEDVHLSVLFVGNSYIYVNKLPSVVAELDAATPGVTLEIDSVVKGGATLLDQWTTTGAREAIESGSFDTVVLQGQSVEPITQPAVFQEYAALLGQAVRDAGGHPVWYATWARRAGDPFYTSGLVATPEEMTAALDAGYVQASGAIEPVAHAGRAWQEALTASPDLVLHDADGSHPSPAGTLLTAFVMFRAITGMNPEIPDPPPLEVSPELAAGLQQFALAVSPCDADHTWSEGICAAVP